MLVGVPLKSMQSVVLSYTVLQTILCISLTRVVIYYLLSGNTNMVWRNTCGTFREDIICLLPLYHAARRSRAASFTLVMRMC